MNKLVLTALLAVVGGAFVTPNTAKAGDGDEVAAAIGGFIGGVIVGSSIDRDHDHRHHGDSGVHVGARIEFGRDRHDHRHGHRHGYWDTKRVRVWVPGHWVVSVDDCGRRHRHFVRGYHEWRRERVWVPTRDHRWCDDRHCR